MRTITFFAPKGGAGRTTAIMTAASALIQAGHRIGVLDMTEQARLPPHRGQSLIAQWYENMLASGIRDDQLYISSAWDQDSVGEERRWFQSFECSHVLIDTPKEPSDLVIQTIQLSQLTVVPFTGYVEASIISDWIRTNYLPGLWRYGLATGLSGPEEQQAVHRDAFYGSFLFKNSLPRSKVFATQLMDGSFYKLKAGPEASGYTEVELRHARQAATAYAKELLKRARLRGFDGYDMKFPLATGYSYAHLDVLREASPEAFN